ncbi:MAG TPA: AraC family transcriptional regulator [Chitinophagales bacterium]|nr:AraC family transcriptional regulator [Chitinophagales bacterium]
MQPSTLNTKQSTIHIRNMVCDSCVKVVRWELERTGFIRVEHVELGKAVISHNEQVIGLPLINEILQNSGFGIIDEREDKLVEQIKQSVVQLIFFGNNTNTILRNSDYLSQKLGEPYHVLSKIFSQKTNVTLEKYIIQIKMEKVKELISYGELTLSEIAHMMGYSSVQYLSNQFKQVTGINVNDYKKDFHKKRTPLNRLPLTDTGD